MTRPGDPRHPRPWDRPARPRAVLAALALLAVTLLASAPPAAAEGQAPRLGLTPAGQAAAYFDLTLVPGEQRHLEVEAANFGDEAVLARTYAADVYSIVNGGFGADLYGEDATGTTSWLTYATQQITLGPREALIVSVAVTVPGGTPPGQYIAALVIENVEPQRGTGPVALDQVNRNAIAVAIDVPGPRQPTLMIGAVGHKSVAGHSIVTFEVDNPGSVHLKPTGAVRLLDAGRSEIASARVVMDSVYASTGTLLEVPLADPLLPGDYCAELSLTDPATGAHDATGCMAFSVGARAASPGADSGPALPWGLPGTSVAMTAVRGGLLVIAGGALVGVAILLVVRRRRSRHRTPAAPARRRMAGSIYHRGAGS